MYNHPGSQSFNSQSNAQQGTGFGQPQMTQNNQNPRAFTISTPSSQASFPQQPMQQFPNQNYNTTPFVMPSFPQIQQDPSVFALQSQVKSLKSDLEDKEERISKLTKKLTETEKEVEKVKQKNSELNFKLSDTQQKFIQLKDEQGSINVKAYQLETEKGLLKQKVETLQQIVQQSKTSQVSDQINEVMKKNETLVKENLNLKQAVSQVSSQFGGSHLQEEINELQKKCQKKEKETKQYADINQQLQQQISEIQSQVASRDQTINKLQTESHYFEKKTKQLSKEISRLTEESKINQVISESQNKMIDSIRKSGINNPLLNSIDQEMNQKILSIQMEYDNQKRSVQDSKIYVRQMKENEQKRLTQERQNKAKQAREIMKRFQESHGMIDICFLIDTTGSMEPYKEQARKSVDGSIESVKKLTQRDTRWSAVCYKDFEELKQLNNYYEQMDFTSNPKAIQEFINRVRCNGGGDGAEDVEGGIKQAVRDLQWQSNFKVLIHICDYPCHGSKFHDPAQQIMDDYKNKDMTQVVEVLADRCIFFIALNFTPKTVKMFEEIRKIYKSRNREEYFYLQDLSKSNPDKLFQEIVQVITKVSCTVTQANVRQTRQMNYVPNNQAPLLIGQKIDSSIPQNFNPLDKNSISSDSPVEQLAKMSNFNMTNCVEEDFKVFTLKVKEESFIKKYKSIQDFSVNDFSIEEEALWNCKRTKAPFATGAVKAAYLMSKLKRGAPKDEMYVIKIPINQQPYQTKEEVLKDCMYHVLCQKYLKTFWEDIDKALYEQGSNKKYPRFEYSDILLLQDSNKKFWMAERYFKGDFVKYNNNFGFVDASKTEMNQIANSFSYYTYYKSDFQHLVCDIQGVGVNLTDPAICTTKNHRIEKTDAGEDGIGRFLIGFQQLKELCKPIFDLLKIDYDANK